MDGKIAKDVTSLASWSVSSSTTGHGILGIFSNLKALSSDKEENYWQSDGEKPHMIAGFFHTAQRVVSINIKINLFLDESYTPSLIRIRTGQSPFTAEDVVRVPIDMSQISPEGWISIPLPNSKEDIGKAHPVRVLQIEVEDCVESGKDVRMRGIKVYAEPL